MRVYMDSWKYYGNGNWIKLMKQELIFKWKICHDIRGKETSTSLCERKWHRKSRFAIPTSEKGFVPHDAPEALIKVIIQNSLLRIRIIFHTDDTFLSWAPFPILSRKEACFQSTISMGIIALLPLHVLPISETLSIIYSRFLNYASNMSVSDRTVVAGAIIMNNFLTVM